MLDVPQYTAYRENDMTQSRSGLQDIVKKVAEEYFVGKTVEAVELEDNGSNLNTIRQKLLRTSEIL